MDMKNLKIETLLIVFPLNLPMLCCTILIELLKRSLSYQVQESFQLYQWISYKIEMLLRIRNSVVGSGWDTVNLHSRNPSDIALGFTYFIISLICQGVIAHVTHPRGQWLEYFIKVKSWWIDLTMTFEIFLGFVIMLCKSQRYYAQETKSEGDTDNRKEPVDNSNNMSNIRPRAYHDIHQATHS